MSATSATTSTRLAGALAGRILRTFQPPVRSAQFWVVQVGVVSIALVHDVLLVGVSHHSFSVGDAMTSALLIVPVIYAALNFGVRGSVATAVWASVLIAPHWAFMESLTERHLIIELGNLAVLNLVAVVVGQRVESERRARHRAEGALQEAATASLLYRSLFEQQPAPVIIADSSGTIGEVNTAAMRLFGPVRPGSALRDLLTVNVSDLLGSGSLCLPLRTAEGDQRLFVPTARALQLGDSRELTQVVLTDVTDQHRRQEEQRLFSGRLLAVQEEERRRLAQELHDDPLQNLVYLTRTLDEVGEDANLPARLATTVRHGTALAADTSTALRKVIHGLRPPILDDIGVVSAVRQLVAGARSRGTLSVELRCTGTEPDLTPELRLTVYRIVQEALNNAMRHADAGHVTVRLRFGDCVTVTVSDDGHGLPVDFATADGPRYGMGLNGMTERASLVGGKVRVSPRQPRGTVVRAVLPVGTTAPAAADATH